MAFEKITQEELEKVGVTTLPDIPSLQAEEMKRKFEETAKELIVPRINKLIDELMAEAAAAVIGAAVPEGLPEETEKTVQKVIQAVFDELENHKNDAENPHKVTALQTGAYTKKETDQAIGEKVQQIGAGDMAMATYDTKGLRKDIYEYTDESRKSIEETASVTYAPKAHASTGTTYGVATASLYGHTKLSDTASNSYGTTSGIAATPKCVYQSLLPQKLTPTFKNGCTNAGSTFVYHIGRLVVCQLSVHLPTISAGKWLTMLTIPSVRAISNVACRVPTINGGPSRDFLITAEDSISVANLYAEPEDSGHNVNISMSFISSV